MKTLLIVAGLFFSISGAFVAYFATSDAGHEYDLNLVLPIDTREMPKPIVPPEVVSRAENEAAKDQGIDGRAEAGRVAPMPERPPVQFGNRPGAASEGNASE
jgi:hypothetical protein